MFCIRNEPLVQSVIKRCNHILRKHALSLDTWIFVVCQWRNIIRNIINQFADSTLPFIKEQDHGTGKQSGLAIWSHCLFLKSTSMQKIAHLH